MRRAALAAAALALAVAGAEALARLGLGLGDPPLTVRDPEIEYLFAPSRSYRRFGNLVRYNAWSMRSDDFGRAKARPDELRVLVLGDSVVNGGALVDQARVATSLLQAGLRARGLPAVVGNVSAGSWGPANLLAYVRRHGWFDADLALVVVGTGDIADVPLFEADLGPDFPERAPPLALWEAATRYLPRHLPAPRPAPAAPAPSREERARRLAEGERALMELLAEAKARTKGVAVVHHRERGEAPGSDLWRALRATVAEAGVPLIDDGPVLAAVPGAYLDAIHLGEAGQAAHAALLGCLVDALLRNGRGGIARCEAAPATARAPSPAASPDGPGRTGRRDDPRRRVVPDGFAHHDSH